MVKIIVYNSSIIIFHVNLYIRFDLHIKTNIILIFRISNNTTTFASTNVSNFKCKFDSYKMKWYLFNTLGQFRAAMLKKSHNIYWRQSLCDVILYIKENVPGGLKYSGPFFLFLKIVLGTISKIIFLILHEPAELRKLAFEHSNKKYYALCKFFKILSVIFHLLLNHDS